MTTNKMERRFSFSPSESEKYRAQVVNGDKKSRTIRGTGIIFNQKSKIITEYISDKNEVRTFYEIIDPAAADVVLNTRFDVVMDVNHSFEQILGRIAAGTLSLTKDNVGVHYEFDCLPTERGEDVLQNVRAGNYYESSFAFVVAEDKWEQDAETGMYTRTILRIETLYDMAICTYRGAYNDTNIEADCEKKTLEYKKEDLEVAVRKLNELMEKRDMPNPIMGMDLTPVENQPAVAEVKPDLVDLPRLDPEVLAILNLQIKNELNSSQMYREMSCWLNDEKWPDATKLFFFYADEELIHMSKIYQYIFDKNCPCEVPESDPQKEDYKDIKEILETALQHEIDVTKEWEAIVALALAKGDNTTVEFSQWFLKEQVEEEDKIRTIIEKLNLDMPKYELDELFGEMIEPRNKFDDEFVTRILLKRNRARKLKNFAEYIK